MQVFATYRRGERHSILSHLLQVVCGVLSLKIITIFLGQSCGLDDFYK